MQISSFFTLKDLMPFVSAIGISVFTSWLALKNFFAQKKSERLHQIYYEEGFLKPLNCLEELLSLMHKNAVLREYIQKYILEKIYTVKILGSSLSEEDGISKFRAITGSNYVRKMVDEIKFLDVKIFDSDIKDVYDKVVFASGLHFHEWLRKFQEDSFEAIFILKDFFAKYEDSFCSNQKHLIFDEKSFEIGFKKIDHYFKTVQMHGFLLPLLFDLRSCLALKSYKNKNALIRELKKDEPFKNLIQTFVEMLKILFFYYKTDEGTYITYAREENKEHYQIVFDKQGVKVSTFSGEFSRVHFGVFMQEKELMLATCVREDNIDLQEQKLSLAKLKWQEYIDAKSNSR